MKLPSVRPMLARALIITRREIRDQLRDWRILAPIIILTLFFPLLMNFTAQQATNFVAKYGAELIGDRIIPFLLMVVGFFPISISLVIALESFVGEKERFSLEPLLNSPLTDLEVYIGKALASMVPPLLAAYLGMGVYLAGLWYSMGWVATPILLVQMFALTTVQALVMVSGAVVISTQATSVRAANLMASFIIIPFSLLIQGESLVMFWGQYEVIWWILLGLVLLMLVLIRMGVKLFNREELLGRDIDEINLKAAWRFLASEFLGPRRGGGLWGWYRYTVWPIFRRLGWPTLMMVAALLSAIILGYRYASVYRLPLETMTLKQLSEQFSSSMAQVGLDSTSGALFIWLVNLRALFIATAAGMFSFGVLAVLLLMVPMILSGYFAGQMLLLGLPVPLFFVAFILPHGIFEIPAAILEGAVILQLGASIIAPPSGKTLGQGWLAALADWAKISLGVVAPLLVLAAVAEIFLTPIIVRAVLLSVGG